MEQKIHSAHDRSAQHALRGDLTCFSVTWQEQTEIKYWILKKEELKKSVCEFWKDLG